MTCSRAATLFRASASAWPTCFAKHRGSSCDDAETNGGDMTTTSIMTAEELEAMAPDGRRYELIRGELREVAAAGGEHGTLGFEVGAFIRDHAKPRRLG